MDFSQHGFPGTEDAGTNMGNMGHSGCGCSTFPGPTPSPFPPSPMTPGPSIHPGGSAGAPGPAQGMPHQGFTGYSHGPYQMDTGAGGHQPHPGTYQSASMHHPRLHDANHYGYYPHAPVQQAEPPSEEGYSILGLNLSDWGFWKGALIGTALTLLITNDTVQKAIMAGVVKAYSAAQDGFGEIKEMFEDAQAELKKPGE
ncbi:MAG: hypothetical protein V1897_13835 [Pseudomonadota bacterium]